MGWTFWKREPSEAEQSLVSLGEDDAARPAQGDPGDVELSAAAMEWPSSDNPGVPLQCIVEDGTLWVGRRVQLWGDSGQSTATIVGLVRDGVPVDSAAQDETVDVTLDETDLAVLEQLDVIVHERAVRVEPLELAIETVTRTRRRAVRITGEVKGTLQTGQDVGLCSAYPIDTDTVRQWGTVSLIEVAGVRVASATTGDLATVEVTGIAPADVAVGGRLYG